MSTSEAHRHTKVWRRRARCRDRSPLSNLDIQRTAHLWIQQHGENAVAKAREQMERLRRKGDAEGADTLLRIIVAISDLGTPPSDARL